MTDRQPILIVSGLKTFFYTDIGIAKAVDGVSFSLLKGKTLGIVGESGCGKSVTGLSIMQLVAQPPGKITSGQIIFEGSDLLDLSEREMRRIRGNRISMIFQEPMTSLNPLFTAGEQVSEVLRLHIKLNKTAAREKALEMLEAVKIPSPKHRFHSYPHQLSGGMRQRVMIAMALACQPDLVIADEPTTALDVTIQAQILGLIQELKDQTGCSMILITHDIGVIAETAQDVIVMYSGKIREYANVDELFENPHHPYTKGLLKSVPMLSNIPHRLPVIPGIVPSLHNLPAGCHFRDRCNSVFDKCRLQAPPLFEIESHAKCRCWLYE
jgi:peptide/nickel transport system ATP-binding protein/oligopeptide transport system ATP-binding protein